MSQSKTVPVLLTIIAVLFVSILVTLAVYLPKNQSAPVKIDVALTPTGTPVVTTVPTTTISPTTISAIPKDWKTYTNTAFHYQLKYPPSWVFYGLPGNEANYQSSEANWIALTNSVGQTIPGSTGYDLNVKIEQITNSTCPPTIEDCIYHIYKSYDTPIPPGSLNKEIVNGNEAYTYSQNLSESATVWKTFFIKNNGQLYIITITANSNGKKEDILFFDQIISTFKFTQ